MCFCQPCILICGTREFQGRPINIEGYPEPPNKIICPYCSNEGPAVYKTDDNYFSFCFIPCCLIGKSEPFLVCSRCSFKLGTNEYNECRCGTSVSKDQKYCQNCGTNNVHANLRT
ncbi:hypothetical protein A0H76_2432 [Hepatospora eriocheir]|uniref:Zinc-ribbon 15 domain-containing protein n=1 Tax=Hepatospora eriocheir TaxID=1081669 RepID=A0A1X0QJW4_9MICR|nr:hypothetical protein A0H76_2432 [Hepatospora eriocheir]